MSRKKYIFAFAFEKFTDRDVAQLVAHTSGGREVASSSLVIPTKSNVRGKRLRSLPFFYIFSSRRIVEFFCLELENLRIIYKHRKAKQNSQIIRVKTLINSSLIIRA